MRTGIILKNKILLTAVALLASFFGIYLFVPDDEPKLGSIPPHLQLKTPDSRIVGVKDIGRGEVVYLYKKGVLADRNPNDIKARAVITREVVEARDINQRVYATNKKDEYVAELYTGEPKFWKDPQGVWWELEAPATTTREAFDQQVAQVWNPFGIKIAYGASTTTYPQSGTGNGTQGFYFEDDTGAGSTWAATRDNTVADGGGTFNVEATLLTARERATGAAHYQIFRTGGTYDLSVLGAGADITDATISYYVAVVGGTLTACREGIYSFTPADPDGIVLGDYDQTSGVPGSGGTILTQSIAFAQATTSQYNDMGFNATGLTYLEGYAGGVVGLMYREVKYDGENTDPGEANALCNIDGYMTGPQATAPKLTVTYTAAPPAASIPRKGTPIILDF